MDFRSFYSSEWSDFPLGKSILLLLTLFVGVGGMLEGRYVAGVQQRAAAASKGSPKNPAPAGSKAAPKPSSSAPSVVYYRRDIKPLLDARCASCHGNGTRLGGFSIDSREAIITGGANHPAVVPGKSSESYLIKLVSGAVPGKIMPLQGPRLTPAEIGKLKAWIDAGLPFDDGVKSSAWKPILAPRKPALPPVPAGTNLTSPIDRLLTPYYKANKVPPRPLVGDRTFARRAYLDIVGLLPDPEALRAFVEDQRPDKRERLVRRLLDDKKNYAEHWLTFWNDLLRNDYTGTGYIDGGRKPITGWLYAALQDNMPYDRFVSQLVNPTPETEGFTNGIIWRGVVNASQTPQMQAAQNISQVFMGVNLKCASCHNSFINDWKLADAYGMAGIYADKALEMVRCDQPTGEVAPIKFLYPELGTIDADAPKRQRMEKLAEILTGKQNGRLTRTFVNRIWTRLMGRGLIEPNDEMDHPPWNADLLDWLAADFADNGYDVKRLIGQIVTSKAYQLPSSGLPSEDVKEFVFRGPVRKRLSAEQFVDAASTLTDVWQKPAVNGLRIVKGAPVLPAGGRAALKWASEVMRSGAAEVDVDLAGAETLALIATDAGDGQSYDWANWVEPRLTGPKGEIRLTDLAWRTGTTGYGKIQKDRSIVEKPLRLGEKTYAWGIGTHANSILTYWLPQGVTRFRATVGPDSGSLEESKVSNAKPSVRFFVVTGDGSLTESRASMAVADPLMTALGRPNREQTVTQRASAATTLQALELTNGETLAAMIRQGAEKAVKERGKNAPQLIRDLYARALSRPPTPEEEKMALKVAGSPVSASGVEDLLWGLMMLPEFQLY